MPELAEGPGIFVRAFRMSAMPSLRIPRQRRAFYLALLASGALHLAILLFPEQPPAASGQHLPARMEARLQPRVAVPETPAPADVAPQAERAAPAKARSRARIISAAKSPTPTWTAAEKAEMDSFLDELGKAPKPTLAQRSLAMAREQGRQMAARDEEGEALLELRPGGPPVDPFSLELYLDGLVRRLNRSALHVDKDRRNQGVRPAAIHFRLNPDGSLKSFDVLNAGDQRDEIAFIKAVVERSVPFSPFPPDIDKAARSLGITICISPGRGDGSPGFSRTSGGRCR